MHTNGARLGENGSAMVITMLVMVILTLLGISFLMMGETENRIAQNEKLSAQALYVAETGVWQVKRWFDRPESAINLLNPPEAEVDRTLRLLDVDGDPTTAPVAQNGGAFPMYKQGIDLDGDGNDDLFKQPYRGGMHNLLLGTVDGPDMRMTWTANGFLDQLSGVIFGTYPGVGGVQARIQSIDIYGPPYIQLGGGWTRYGMGTIRVKAQIYQTVGAGIEILSERWVTAVLNEMPYPGPFGPLHSCDTMSWNGDWTVYWGTSTAVANSDLTNNLKKIAVSWPRLLPPGEKVDLLYGANNQANWLAYMAEVDGEQIEDPWYRYLTGGAFTDAPNGNNIPYPFLWAGGAPADTEWPNQNHGNPSGTRSNIMQNMPQVSCPEFDYEVWKGIATSGASDVHYYVWDNGSSFKENGFGTAQTFRSITDQETGLFFFDTTDGQAPHDDDADGTFENMTPEIMISGGTWGARGFFYLNTLEFGTKGVGGRAATFNAPGEPYRDANQNGHYDAGEDWINLTYPNTLGGVFTIDDGEAGKVRDSKGPNIATTASMWGILFNNGEFNGTGNATFYGSLISKSGVGEGSPSAGTPYIYWDESIKDNWPPAGWDLPRVMITRWETDL